MGRGGEQSVCRGLGLAGPSDPDSGSGFEIGCGGWKQEESHPAEPKAKGFSLRRKGPGWLEQAAGAYRYSLWKSL